MKTVTKVVDGVIKTLMATSAFVLFLVTFLQVVFRFILKSPLAWSQDVIRSALLTSFSGCRLV